MKEYKVNNLETPVNWEYVNSLSDFTSFWNQRKTPGTIFQAYHDKKCLYFKFTAYGSKPLVNVKDNNKLEVIHSERVEIFFRCNEKMNPYYCLEMDPHGRVLDYSAKYYRNFDYDWDWPEKLNIQTRICKDYYTVESSINLSTLGNLGLLSENEIQAGLFRGHCTKLTDNNATMEWISWVDPKTEKPDFHIPMAFGKLIII